MTALIKELEDIVGKDGVLASKEERICYSYDAQLSEAMPDVVVIPENAGQISKIMKLANRRKVKVVPRGSGTGLSGGSVPVNGGILLLLRKLDKIITIDRENLMGVAESGVVTARFCEAAEKVGLMYPPYPSSYKTSMLGGNIASNAGGVMGLKYGVTGDYVMGMEVVLPTGEIIKTGANTVKSVSGYDLTGLLVGSEGTLCIVTEATLKLVPKPEFTQSLLVVFNDIESAAKSVSEIISAGIIPSALEIMDNATINAIEDFKKIGMPKTADAVLLIEADGIKEAVEKDAARISDICEKLNAESIKTAKTISESKELWEARTSALPALARIKPTTMLEDVTVPRGCVPEMITYIQQIAKKYDIMIGTFGHIGDGNLHPTILTDKRDREEMERVEKAIEEIFKTAIELGGTVSGEHGVGLTKSRFLKMEKGKEGIEVMRAIKNALDPNNILNPGKIFG